MVKRAKDNHQGFTILGLNDPSPMKWGEKIEANACFMYKGYEISMSTSGCNSGGCLKEVMIFNGTSSYAVHSVQDAIEMVDGLIKRITEAGE